MAVKLFKNCSDIVPVSIFHLKVLMRLTSSFFVDQYWLASLWELNYHITTTQISNHGNTATTIFVCTAGSISKIALIFKYCFTGFITKESFWVPMIVLVLLIFFFKTVVVMSLCCNVGKPIKIANYSNSKINSFVVKKYGKNFLIIAKVFEIAWLQNYKLLGLIPCLCHSTEEFERRWNNLKALSCV